MHKPWNLILTLGVAAVFCLPARADEWAKKYTLTGSPTLRVETNDGNVTVNTWDKNEISVEITTVGWKIGPGDVRIEERQSGNQVEVNARVPRMNWSWGFNNHSLKIIVTAPRTGDLNVHTGDGHVELRSFSGNTMIHTGDGHITLESVKGPADVSTGDGHVSARSFEGSLRVSTGDGHIEVDGRFDNLDLKTGDGRINVAIDSGSAMKTPWHINTHDGSVVLRLPDKFSADLDAETRDGHISLDFPVTVSGKLSQSHVHGPINGGGPTLSVHTGDGHIRIERR
ncbi:MAG: DUF4097 family beta strand repeat protein [Acidobacteria bacterium]|nr:DUF4097 family beta strand repeat protein [Acidobacteriota bacterium]